MSGWRLGARNVCLVSPTGEPSSSFGYTIPGQHAVEDLRYHKSDAGDKVHRTASPEQICLPVVPYLWGMRRPELPFAHELTAVPSNEVVNGIHARMKAHVEEFPNRENT
jgi:hypothetical protein